METDFIDDDDDAAAEWARKTSWEENDDFDDGFSFVFFERLAFWPSQTL